MVYFPNLDTRTEVSSYTRTEILRKVRYLYANTGFPKRIINGSARMVVGTGLTPQARTKDDEWNDEAEDYYYTRGNSPFTWDLGGRYTADKAQLANTRFRYRDGDSGTVLTTGPASQALHAYYEGHQIGGAPDNDTTGQWRDGVRTDNHNRPTHYHITGPGGKSTIIPAAALILNIDYERGGQARGVSKLHHAIPHLLDGPEILGYVKAGVKLANQYGYVIEDENTTGAGSPTMGGRVAGGPTRQVTLPNGGRISLEQVLGGGAIPELPPGKKIRFLQDQRPHPNQLTLMDYMIRDVSWGFDLAPEILWNIATLGGANTRFVLADAQGWIETEQQDLVNTLLARDWIYTIGLALHTGHLRPCRDPQWWKHYWLPPPRLTVDFGRDGKLYLEQIKAGALTYKRFHGWQGLDWRVEIDQALDEAKHILDGLRRREIPLADYLSLRSGIVTANQAGEEDDTCTHKTTTTDTDHDDDTDELGISRIRGEATAQLDALATALNRNPDRVHALIARLAPLADHD
jgi:hypothetical protein